MDMHEILYQYEFLSVHNDGVKISQLSQVRAYASQHMTCPIHTATYDLLPCTDSYSIYTTYCMQECNTRDHLAKVRSSISTMVSRTWSVDTVHDNKSCCRWSRGPVVRGTICSMTVQTDYPLLENKIKGIDIAMYSYVAMYSYLACV